MRERTEDLKYFGRVGGALLHGTALKSQVFRTALGLWLKTNPGQSQKKQCLACHAPAVTVFPKHTDRIMNQVLAGPQHVKLEGTGCTSCHLINSIARNSESYPAFRVNDVRTIRRRRRKQGCKLSRKNKTCCYNFTSPNTIHPKLNDPIHGTHLIPSEQNYTAFKNSR